MSARPRSLREAGWRVVRFGGSLFGFAALWFFIAFMSLIIWGAAVAGLPVYVGSDVFYGSVIIGQVSSVFILIVCRHRRLSRSHVQRGLQRPMETNDAEAAASRLQEAFEELELFLSFRMTPKAYQAFFLRRVKEEGRLPEDEVPRSLSELLLSISLDLSDRMRAEKYPWPSMESILTSLEKALASDTPDLLLRDTLTTELYRTSRWYRQFVVSPPVGPLGRFLQAHKAAFAALGSVAIFTATLLGILT